MKYGDCIRCGWCCLDIPCGLGGRGMTCPHLSVDEVGVHTCALWPFENEDTFTKIMLEPKKGCGYGGENPMYKRLWSKLKIGEYDGTVRQDNIESITQRN